MQLRPILVCPETPPLMQAMCQHAEDIYMASKRLVLLMHLGFCYYECILRQNIINMANMINMAQYGIEEFHNTINMAQYGQNGSIWMWMWV